MALINGAYAVLSDPAKRVEYDRIRGTKACPYSSQDPAQPQEESGTQAGYFSLGSTKMKVLEVEGAPDDVSVAPRLNEETWYYNRFDEVTFDIETGLVRGWDNSSESLRVRMVAGPQTAAEGIISIGDHKDQVILLHGTPTGVCVDRYSDLETWDFEEGSVSFSLATGRVIGWENFYGDLKVLDDDIGSSGPPYASTWTTHDTVGGYARQTIGKQAATKDKAGKVGAAVGKGCAFVFMLYIVGWIAFVVVMTASNCVRSSF